jgi:hypothetical protein
MDQSYAASEVESEIGGRDRKKGDCFLDLDWVRQRGWGGEEAIGRTLRWVLVRREVGRAEGVASHRGRMQKPGAAKSVRV